MLSAIGKRWLAIGATGALFVAACGDDDAQDAAPPVEEYCAMVEAIGDELPTNEQLDEIVAVAPDEIAADLQVVADAIKADGEAAFADPEVAASFAPIEEFERENCDGDDSARGTSDEIDPAAQRVDVVATEYSFDFAAPATGAVSFVVTNEGDEVHELQLARFIADATLEDAMASEDPEADGLVESVGFEGPLSPGTEGVLTVEDLTAGRYAVVCFIPAPDGEPHAEKGMVSEFIVE